MAWIFNANEYEEKSFSIIPEGDHRVRISDVEEKTFRSGNDGYEMTLEVSGHSSKLWFYLVLDSNDTKKTNQRIGDFFNSFGITDPDMSHYRSWVGKVGAVKVYHEDYNGNQNAKVRFCISKKNQEKLPEAKFSASAPSAATIPVIEDSELPF